MPRRNAAGTKQAAQPASGLTLVVLVRHGQTGSTGTVLPGRAKGLDLSDVGRIQAAAAADRIVSLREVGALHCSPLERTRQTAAPISKAVGLRATPTRGLLECDFGEWTGRKLADLRKLPEWKVVQSTPSQFRFPGGESFAEMQSRMVDQVETIAASNRGSTIVCVSHADPIKAAIAQWSGIHLDLFQRLVISPCSLSLVLLGGPTPVVLAVNSTGDDLASLAPS